MSWDDATAPATPTPRHDEARPPLGIADPVVARLVAGIGAAQPSAAQPSAPQPAPPSSAPPSRRAARPPGPRRTSPAGDPGAVPLAVLVAAPALVALVLGYLTLRGLRGGLQPGSVLLVLIAGVPLVLIGLAGWHLLHAPVPVLLGAPVSRRQEPRLWQVVEEVSTRLGAPRPVRLAVDGSSLIRSVPGRDGLQVAIGLPLLLELDPDQFRAAVARELALRGNQARPLAARVYRLGEQLSGLTGPGAGIAGPVARVLSAYQGLYRSVARDAVHGLERGADEAAAGLAGSLGPVAAAHRVVVVQLAWEVLVETYLPLAQAADLRPRLAEGLREVLHYRDLSLHDRAAARFPGHTPPRSAAAGTGMIDDLGTLDRIESAVLLDDRPAAQWQQIAEVAGAARVAAGAARLVGFLPTTGEPTLHGVLTTLERPGRLQPSSGLGPGLTALAQDALISLGLARYEMNWSGAPLPQRRDPWTGWVPWDGATVIEAAAQSPTGVAQLRSWLIAAGADLDRRLDRRPRAASSAVGPVEVTGALAGRLDLLVFADGLLLLPAAGSSARERLGLSTTGADGARRLEGVVGAVADSPRRAGGRWIEVSEVTDSALRDRRAGFELQLWFADGSALSVRADETSETRGQVVRDLRRLLPSA